MPKINVLLTPKGAQRLKELASLTGITVSELAAQKIEGLGSDFYEIRELINKNILKALLTRWISPTTAASLTCLSVSLSEETAQSLVELSQKSTVPPEAIASEILNRNIGPSEEFCAMVQRELSRNGELYRRLAR